MPSVKLKVSRHLTIMSNYDRPPESPTLTPQSSIFIAGHRGMVGAAIVRKLKNDGFKNIITRTHSELDLINQQAVREFFQNEKIDYVVLAAAKVGGIHANNTYPAEFIYLNLMIQANVIHEAYTAGVENLLFLGSSCIYPKFAPQPMSEDYLLTGILEPTNEPYAIAKIAGIKMCESYNRQYGTKYRSVMPTNLYGPHDNYHLENSHVLPALIRKFHLAKLTMQGDLKGIQKDEATYGLIPPDIQQAMNYFSANASPKVVIWGTGKARREFLHVDDMAAACTFVMGLDQLIFTNPLTESLALHPHPSFLNIGTGKDITIGEIAQIIKEVVVFEGQVFYDSEKPDGTPQKLLDTTRINRLGWEPEFSLREGVIDAYAWYLDQTKKSL